VQRYDGGDDRDDDAHALGVSPDGSAVFVTGTSYRFDTNFDYATIAYDAATGERLWLRRYHRPDDPVLVGADHAEALGVSPDGSFVFVTGTSGTTSVHLTTVAYDAATGARVWLHRSEAGFGSASSLDVSPDGSRVYVTGNGKIEGSADYDYTTVAYDAFTGIRLWVSRYERAGDGWDLPGALQVAPDGSAVFVTGTSIGSSTAEDYATVAYDATSGATLWASRYNGSGGYYDFARAIGVSPDGSQVFVTGSSVGSVTIEGYDEDYATLAYDATTGARIWTRRYDGPANGSDYAQALSVSPDGSSVFVTGGSEGETNSDLLTVAYSVR
jgi:hypothetical protein